MADPTKPGDDAKPRSAATSSSDPAGPGERADREDKGAGSGMRPDVSFDQLKGIVAHLQKEIDEGQTQVKEEKSLNLRLLADMDNLRKRTEREKEETAKYAISRFAKDIVDVGDNFQRAIQAVPADAAEADPALKSFLEGVTLAERAFLAALERHGVRQIDAKGQPFNPHQHQAVMEMEDATVPAGTVLQVFQAGYMLEDRCLRPAMVVVAKGGPKVAKPADSGASEPSASNGDPPKSGPGDASDPA